MDVPRGAVDCHCHVFGPVTRFPYADNRSYTPPEAPLAEYLDMLATIGVDRGVVVQPSVYGTDNSATLDALRQHPSRLRGVAVVDEDIHETVLSEMHDLGVRGLRINVLFAGGVGLEKAHRLAERVAPFGWHLQFLIDISQTPEFARQLAALPVDSVIDHMGHMPAHLGPEHGAFQDLLSLLREGRTWVKLSGSYRLTGQQDPPYSDVAPLARALVETRSDRLVWATDWPHPAITRPVPNAGDLLDMFAEWVIEPELRERILVHNPQKLYGFRAPA